jgi:TM2 domain-containing membrane protein YozV
VGEHLRDEAGAEKEAEMIPPTPRTNDPAVIEHRLLDLAYTTDTPITAPVLAYYAPCSIEDADRVLTRLSAEDRLRMDYDDEGNVTYTLPGRVRVSVPRPVALVRHQDDALARHHVPNAAVAAVLSMVVPGAGQLYAGRPLAGIAWFMIVTFGYLFLIVPGLLLHILCIASAAAAAHGERRGLMA